MFMRPIWHSNFGYSTICTYPWLQFFQHLVSYLQAWIVSFHLLSYYYHLCVTKEKKKIIKTVQQCFKQWRWRRNSHIQIWICPFCELYQKGQTLLFFLNKLICLENPNQERHFNFAVLKLLEPGHEQAKLKLAVFLPSNPKLNFQLLRKTRS